MGSKGRPAFRVTEEVIAEVEKMAKLGMTQDQIAGSFGITYMTFNKYKKKNKRLKEAFLKGKSLAIKYVSGKLMQLINAGNLTAIIFYLKTQAGWSEKSTLEVKNPVKSKHREYKIETMDQIEASKIYQSIMTGSYKDE